MFWNKRTKTKQTLISPEEILLDAHNLPAHDPHNAEGRINTPIGPRALIPLMLIAALTGLLLVGRSVQLMALEGDAYQELSERNRLGHSPIFAERGIIYDRNGVELAWNIPHMEDGAYEVYDERTYASTTGSGHILGYVRMPARDSRGILYREGIEGVSGVELAYDDVLRGTDGVKIVETDAQLHVVSEGLLEEPLPGKALTLTIDTRLQEALNGIIRDLAEDIPFTGGAGLLMDVQTGELLALTSYPEYDPRALVTGDGDTIAAYSTDARTPYLNRTLAGVYTPGSIVKPYVAAAALAEGIVRPETSFVSTGALRLANPYNPGQYSVFTDWRAHGIVDLTRALAVSSNVYFYYVGGGFGDQEGLGITRIEKYMRTFGFARTTGIILEGEQQGTVPSPTWKEETFPTDPVWRIGDTYNTAIGQYGFLVTPLQVVRAVGALANNGLLLTPRIDTEHTPYTARPIEMSTGHLQTVRAGMRRAVVEGTAKGLNVPYVNVAGKTGTAEVGVSKDHVHSWVMGFYPYEEPRYAFVVMMEHGPRKNLIGGVYVMRNFLDWMHKHTPEYVLFDEDE
jgi:penicillin-binding protein 2